MFEFGAAHFHSPDFVERLLLAESLRYSSYDVGWVFYMALDDCGSFDVPFLGSVEVVSYTRVEGLGYDSQGNWEIVLKIILHDGQEGFFKKTGTTGSYDDDETIGLNQGTFARVYPKRVERIEYDYS